MINIDTRLLPKINESELWLLMMIAKRFDVSKSSFPSNDTLIKETGWGRDKLKKTKDSLIYKGILNVSDRYDKNGKQTSNLYTVNTEYISVFVKLNNRGHENKHPLNQGVGKSDVSPPLKPVGSGVGKSVPEVLDTEVLDTEVLDFYSEYCQESGHPLERGTRLSTEKAMALLTLEEKQIATSRFKEFLQNRKSKQLSEFGDQNPKFIPRAHTYIKDKLWQEIPERKYIYSEECSDGSLRWRFESDNTPCAAGRERFLDKGQKKFYVL